MQLSVPYIVLNQINRALFDRAVLPEEEVDWVLVCRMCKFQSVNSLFLAGLRKSEKLPEARFIEHFQKKEAQELYQYAHQQVEKKKIVEFLEAEKIPYILLKGSRMRQFYPEGFLRTSCDIDILFDGDEALIHEKLLGLEFEYLKDVGTTINYLRKPVEIEMHRYLFDDRMEFQGFFDNVWKYSVPAEEGRSERLLTEEFFYVYMLAHMAKHFTRYGCGVRPVIDLYLYNQKLPAEFDRKKAEKMLKEVGLYGFEQRLCALTKAWFETGKLSEMDEKLTDYIMEAGVFGDSRIMSARGVQEPEKANEARRKKILFYLFPSLKVMRRFYPRMLKCPLLLPAAWGARFCKIFTGERKHAVDQLQEYISVDEGYVSHVTEMTKELHLQ